MNLKNVIFFVFLTKKRGKKFSGKGEENKKNTRKICFKTNFSGVSMEYFLKLKSFLHFYFFISFDHITDTKIVVVGDVKTAFKTFGNFFYIIFEAF